MYKVIFSSLLLILGVFNAHGQSTLPNRFFEFGFSTNSYKGDLSHSYSQWSNAIHVGILLNKKKRVNGHFNLMVGKAIAQNPNYFYDDGEDPQPNPNKFARIKLFTLNYDIHINLYKKNNFIVYLYQGFGLVRFSPKDSDDKKLTDQLSTRAPSETYSNFTVMLPHGIGALYLSKPGFGVGFQAGFLNTMSDYLDNVSKWGDRIKKDNILSYKLTVYVPFPAKAKTVPSTTPLN